MQTYVALLRGIMPTNPDMKSDRLKGFFESLGFENVRTVIASGNVVFESKSKDAEALEKKIEQALPHQLKFESTTMVRGMEKKHGKAMTTRTWKTVRRILEKMDTE